MSEKVPTVRVAGNEWSLPLLVISPHLDDAVLSAGNVLNRLGDCVVLTVLAGNPGTWSRVTDWDRSCGFDDGDDVVARRLEENLAALSVLGVRGMELEYLDAQYSPQRPDAGVVGDAIADAVKRAGALSVIAPLGISHADHRLVAEASERARKQLGDINWYVYGDLPYFHEPGGEQQALGIREGLAEQGVRLSPLQGSAAFPPKTAALDLYTSQRKGLGEQRIQIALKPERYWRVTRP